jgi:hypothetical protein
MALALMCPGFASAEPPAYTEYQVKAAFLYNFAKFVDWKPVEASSPEFVIAILGDDPFGESFDRSLAGRRLNGKPIRIRRLADLSETDDVQLLFVSRSEAKRFRRVLRRLKGRPVLTVADAPGFAQAGGMIELFMRNQSVRFRVNLGAATETGLQIQPNLLRLAEVIGEPLLPASPAPPGVPAPDAVGPEREP